MRKEIFALTLSFGTLLLPSAGCSASPDGNETNDSLTSAAIYCRQGQDCYPGVPTYSCDPTTRCCVSGSPGWAQKPTDADAGAAERLYTFENALRSWQCTVPKAVALDEYGHWWFGSVCPYNSSDSAIIDLIVKTADAPPLAAYDNAVNHCIGAPAQGYTNVLWDPMCPGGCLQNLDY